MVSIQSSNGYLFHKVYFTISTSLTVSVYVLKQCLSGLELIHQRSTELMHYGAVT